MGAVTFSTAMVEYCSVQISGGEAEKGVATEKQGEATFGRGKVRQREVTFGRVKERRGVVMQCMGNARFGYA